QGLELVSPSRKLTFRPIDPQSPLGLYVGKTADTDGQGTMTSYEYLDGANFQPSDEEVRRKRPADLQ
ncbi:MAG: branched-chain amino acid transport system substrate-binding protein, partial [Alphaproteobacteria bacterium]|nr:branched-chain amino acid transport system substrate-binding protein [Alphaproteobacteria bacterium]